MSNKSRCVEKCIIPMAEGAGVSLGRAPAGGSAAGEGRMGKSGTVEGGCISQVALFLRADVTFLGTTVERQGEKGEWGWLAVDEG